MYIVWFFELIPHSPEIKRRCPRNPAKSAYKITLILEPRLKRDLRDRFFRPPQKFFRLVRAVINQIFIRGHSGKLFEQLDKIILGKMGDLGKIVERNWLRIICLLYTSNTTAAMI